MPKEEREWFDSHEQHQAYEYEVIAVSPCRAQNSWYLVCWANVECVFFNLDDALDDCHKKKIDHKPVDLEEPFVVVVLIHWNDTKYYKGQKKRTIQSFLRDLKLVSIYLLGLKQF